MESDPLRFVPAGDDDERAVERNDVRIHAAQWHALESLTQVAVPRPRLDVVVESFDLTILDELSCVRIDDLELETRVPDKARSDDLSRTSFLGRPRSVDRAPRLDGVRPIGKTVEDEPDGNVVRFSRAPLAAAAIASDDEKALGQTPFLVLAANRRRRSIARINSVRRRGPCRLRPLT